MIRYAHTNLIARDWRRLARFYEEVFGCIPVPPERDQAGEWLELATGVAGARLRGAHLRLPGYGDGGPTLEIHTYAELVEAGEPVANRLGYGHLAFEVDDVPGMLQRVIEAGGAALGEVVRTHVPGAGGLVLTYARDPEGNIIELQRWSDAA